MDMKLQRLSAWGGSKTALCMVSAVDSESAVGEVLKHARQENLTVCCRAGAGSHGDSVLNEGQIVLDVRAFNQILSWDSSTGVMVTEPGVTFAQALKMAMPDGWVVPCAPGGLKISMAGALSFDVHGKDGVHNGNFGDHVRGFHLITADGSALDVTPESEPELFNAVVGGMGLLGVITQIELQLIEVPSSLLTVRKKWTCSVREALGLLDRDDLYDYAIGWIDPFAPGEKVGRGYMTTARWSDKPVDMKGVDIDKLFSTSTKVFGLVESSVFWMLVRPFFRPSVVRWVNLLHYTLGRVRFLDNYEKERFFPQYIYIHNFIPNVNYVYKPKGLVTVQPLIPRSAGHDAVVGLLHLCQRHGVESMMAGIKRRSGNKRYLSFALDGYSFSIDLQLRGRNEERMNKALKEIYQYVVDVGGRVYLAKDDRLPEKYFKQMYPMHNKFWDIKMKVDPNCMFLSDQARRVFGLNSDK
jgi:FAD/FMN-containing dehydrogenase